MLYPHLHPDHYFKLAFVPVVIKSVNLKLWPSGSIVATGDDKLETCLFCSYCLSYMDALRFEIIM